MFIGNPNTGDQFINTGLAARAQFGPRTASRQSVIPTKFFSTRGEDLGLVRFDDGCLFANLDQVKRGTLGRAQPEFDLAPPDEAMRPLEPAPALKVAGRRK